MIKELLEIFGNGSGYGDGYYGCGDGFGNGSGYYGFGNYGFGDGCYGICYDDGAGYGADSNDKIKAGLEIINE